jgi:hypothetical protein
MTATAGCARDFRLSARDGRSDDQAHGLKKIHGPLRAQIDEIIATRLCP